MKITLNHRLRSFLFSSTMGFLLVVVVGGSLVANLTVEQRRVAKEAKEKARYKPYQRRFYWAGFVVMGEGF